MEALKIVQNVNIFMFVVEPGDIDVSVQGCVFSIRDSRQVI
jgi:hypothetical protein